MKTDRSVDLGTWTASRRRQLELVFEARLPARAASADPGRLVEAMRYSLLAPGKRLRPLLALAAAEAIRPEWGGSAASPTANDHDHDHDQPLLIAAASVELVHCYSLIHDDLPAMDDDDFRRGKPSNHKVFGEATAILAGDALLTLAFEWLAEAGAAAGRPADFARAALALARGAGMTGMVRGQARDLGEAAPSSLEALERLHAEKTAALFGAAAAVGAAAAGGTSAEVTAVAQFGQHFGVAFQHADDREDGDHRAHSDHVAQRVPQLLREATRALDTLAARPGERGAALRAISAELLQRVVGKSTSPAPTED